MFKFKSGEGVAKAGEPAEIENSKQEEGALKQTPISENSVAENPVTKNEGAAAQDVPASPSQDDVAKVQALRSKMISASFGEIVTLLMSSSHYKHYSLSDLEWLVIPALLTNQFLVVEAQMKAPVAGGQSEGAAKESVAGGQPDGAPVAGPRIPVGLALWAKVSPEVDEKLSANLDAPVKLRPDEWRSGEVNWLIGIIGDQQIMAGLYAKLKDDVFKGQTFKVRAQNKEGQRVVTEVSGGVEESTDGELG